jgi:Secretion system C-terminal sorting domain
MKRTLLTSLFLFAIIFIQNGFSQRNSPFEIYKALSFPAAIARPNTPIPCTPIGTPSGCNLINNPNFIPDPTYNPLTDGGDPFAQHVPSWLSSHGSPNIYDPVVWNFTPPPAVSSGYARMACLSELVPPPLSEGIVQQIAPLKPGEKYLLSFFKKTFYFQGVPASPVQNFRIILMHCSDYNNFNTNSYEPPAIPVNSQVIYCDDNVNNLSWQQITTCFSAQQAFNMIWIYPIQNDVSNANLFFSYPELISVNNFTAGSSPNPTLPNCRVTIGPANPNCSVANAIFTWHGPNGQIRPADANQQVVVFTDISAEIGIWTLKMTVPGAISGGGNCIAPPSPACNIQATVNVPACSNPVWPKVYGTTSVVSPQPTGRLRIDNNGNVFMGLSSPNMTVNINHDGGAVPTTSGEYCIHYNKSTGITNWISAGITDRLGIVLNSGDIQIITSNFPQTINTIYRNCQTGLQTPGPSIVPANEIILAEDNGTYLTNSNTHLWVRSIAGSTSTQFNFPFYYSTSINRAIYNPSTKKLFVCTEGAGVVKIAVYKLINNVLVPQNNPNNTPPQVGLIVQVNTNDEVFTVGHGFGTYKYDYINNTYSPFFNAGAHESSNNYVEDQQLFSSPNSNDYSLYYINTKTLMQKKISFTSIVPGNFFIHLFEGDDLYYTGGYELQSVGTHAIPQIGGPIVFLDKLNVQSDFTLRTVSPAAAKAAAHEVATAKSSNTVSTGNIIITPNPASDKIRVELKEFAQMPVPTCTISIYNTTGIMVLTRKVNSAITDIDIKSLTPGVYHLSVTHNGIRRTKYFVKQ